MRNANALLTGLLVLATGTLVWGQAEIEGHTFLPEERWGRLSAAEEGKKFYLEGRWDGIYLEEVKLHVAPGARGFVFVKAGSPVQGRLSGDQDSLRRKLHTKSSTVRLFTTAKRKGNRCVVWVSKARKLEDDTVRYRNELAALPENATPPVIQELADRISQLAERYQDRALAEVAQEALQRELQARVSGLKPTDYEGALAVARRMQEVNDLPGAIQVLSDFETRASGAVRKTLRAELSKLGAVFSAGAWLPFDEFKRQEGFVRRGATEWVRRERAEFEVMIATERELQKDMVVLIRGNELRHLHDAEQGGIVRGQTMAEVRLAIKGALPALVTHQRAAAPGPNGGGGINAIWSQWVLEDGRRVYFLDTGGGGEVIGSKAAQDPWPR